MQKIGGYIAVFGIISTILYFLDMNLFLLVWIDNWGEGVGWAIRLGLIALGGILFFVGKDSEE